MQVLMPLAKVEVVRVDVIETHESEEGSAESPSARTTIEKEKGKAMPGIKKQASLRAVSGFFHFQAQDWCHPAARFKLPWRLPCNTTRHAH
jgi:hypothetical protein